MEITVNKIVSVKMEQPVIILAVLVHVALVGLGLTAKDLVLEDFMASSVKILAIVAMVCLVIQKLAYVIVLLENTETNASKVRIFDWFLL